MLKKVDQWIQKLEIIVGSLAMAAIATLVFGTIIARYIFSAGILWADEVVVNLFVLMVMFGSALCFRTQKHTEMTLFLNVLPKKGRLALRIVIQILTFLFLLVFLYSAGLMFGNSLDAKTTVLRLPMSFMYSSLVIGGVLMLYEFVKDVVKRLKDELKGDEKGKLDVVGEATKGDM